MSLNVLLVSDALGPPVRGNATTVARWLAALIEGGTHARAVEPGAPAPAGAAPDLVHAHHALRAGPAGLDLARRLGRPLVVSLGGTDLWALREGHPEGAEVARILRAADLVLGAFDAVGPLLERLLGHRVPYARVRRGVFVEAADPRPARDGPLRVLLPAGIRAVKDPLLAFDLAERLRAAGVALTLRLLGPALEPDAHAALLGALARAPYARWETLPPVAMGGAYLAADVVWNTSRHEGGSNALLEGLAAGCAVFARRVPGNVELFDPAPAPGTLFDPSDTAALVAFHRALLAESPAAAERRRAAARAWLARHHAPADEVAELRAAYAGVTGSTRR